MKQFSSFFDGVIDRIPFLYNRKLKKDASRKFELSHSILDRRTPMWKPFILLAPGVTLIILFTLIPMFFNIYNSLTTSDGSLTLRNYSYVFLDQDFAVGVRNSFIYGIFVLPLTMTISLAVSSVIAKLYRKSVQGFWQSVFFMPYITNAVAVSLVFIQVFSPSGLFNGIFGGQNDWLNSNDKFSFNALLPMVSNGVWSGLAFNILIYTTAMLGVDKNLYRSASIDGCGEVKQFFAITLPSIKSTINFLITFAIIGGLKVFPLALFNNAAADAFKNGGASIMLYVYYTTTAGNISVSGAASIALFIIGVTYSSIIRGGFFMAQITLNNLGERNVWVKVKNSEQVSKK
ncbi:carbohydrate ABC transporter permease [Mycoplasma buteonis]|uniref:carbohydrate ABC transporter permease n=1 Tax=Mycoplasma buteonis TaxID=171280 RepID=UPI000559E353|nr:sugar ABC transporter permease [Mycoplasma buteonis]